MEARLRLGRTVYGCEVGTDERSRDLRDNGIAVAAQASHAGGYPMSQREKAGLSWPGLAVAAGEPGDVRPGTKVASALKGFPRLCVHRFSLKASVAASLR